MALIGEIRKRQWLLLVVIFGALLAFVLSDAFRNSGGSVQERSISNVFGESLTSTEYDQLVKQEIAKYERVYNNVYGQPLPAEVRKQLEDGYLNQYLAERLYQTQYDAIGLKVTKDEFNDILQGTHIDPTLYEQNRLFVDANGRFSEDSMRKLLPVFLQQSPDFSFFLNEVLGDQAEKQRLSKKYNTLITKGLYTTKQEAKKNYLEQNNKVTFNYVFQAYSAIPDSAVEVTEADIKAYYNEHKDEKKYEGKDAISFQYVEFAIEPSEEDKADAKSYLDSNMAKRFKDAKNDSAFVYSNSDSKDLDFSFKKSSDFPDGLDSLLQNADTGDVIGPYYDGEYYKMSKVRDIQTQTEAKVRHILIGKDKYGEDVTKLKAKADSIIRVIRAQNNFDAMVTEFSTDYASVPNGGVYEWFDEYQMVPEFTEVSFKRPIGTLTTATTTYGVHVIEVLDRREGKMLSVATVDVEVRPSKPTIDKAIDKAIDFRNLFDKENMADTAFLNKARANGFFARPVEEVLLSQKTIPGFDNNIVQVKRWGFNAKIGDLSDFMTFDKKVIIAHLKNKSEKGVPSFESVKEEMGYEVIKEKKAALYKGKMQGASLQDIATAIGGTVQTASNISFGQNSVPGVGNEPKMIGTAFGTAANAVSPVVAGDNGVFVLSPTTFVDATIPEGYTFDNEQKSAMMGLRSSAENRVYQALSKAADLEDKRDQVNIIEN